MEIKFAKTCVIDTQQPVRWLAWRIRPFTCFQAFEGTFCFFATVVPLTKVWMSPRPNLTTGFASGHATVSGTNGQNVKPKAVMRRRFRRLIAIMAILSSCASGVAIAKDDGTSATDLTSGNKQVLVNQSSQASVRIISLDELHPRVRFTASGLPVGLAINPQTGEIRGKFDREANRNNGAPFVITINMVVGGGASGTSTVKLHTENRPPSAVEDTLQMSKNPNQLNVLANDIDPDGDRLVLTDAGALYGAVAFMTSGLVTYASSPGQSGPDIIKYTVSDGHGGSAVGTILVTTK